MAVLSLCATYDTAITNYSILLSIHSTNVNKPKMSCINYHIFTINNGVSDSHDAVL
ncbi:MAG: hypothetical protein ACPKQO_04750 [Nitrososphaeraceae archaeon]